MQGFAYFPTIVYRDEHVEWVNYISRISQKYFDFLDNNNFLQTQNMTNCEELLFFENYLLDSTKLILSEQGYFVEKYEFYISGLWGQQLKKGAFTNVHVHKNSQICGWLFLETPKNGSYPVYYDVRLNKQMIELDSIFNEQVTNATSQIHFDNIEPGTVLFSNSWMSHQLTMNMSEQSTKAIHFIISHKEKLCNTF